MSDKVFVKIEYNHYFNLINGCDFDLTTECKVKITDVLGNISIRDYSKEGYENIIHAIKQLVFETKSSYDFEEECKSY